MKRKFLALFTTLVLLLALVLPSCNPVSPPPGIEPSSLIPAASNTYDVGKSGLLWRDVWVYRYLRNSAGDNLSLPTGANTTLVGLTNTQTLTNKTLTSPTINAAMINGTVTIATGCSLTTPSISSPTVTGTSIVSNHQSGISSNLTAGSGTGVIVAHGMSGTPTRIFLSWAGDPGASAPGLYSSSIDSTNFTISLSANVTNSVCVYWLVFIADE